MEKCCGDSILTMNTSNSSSMRNGESATSHSASTKQTVENDRSPPDSDLTSVVVCGRPPCAFFVVT